jgi:hypothetical protein
MDSSRSDIVRSTLRLLEQNAGDIAAAGLTPSIIAMAVSALLCVGVILALRHVGALKRTFGAVAMALLSLNTLLIVVPAVGAGVAIPYSVDHAVALVSEHAEELHLETPVGLVLLAPLVEAFTRDGKDEDALELLEGPRGPSLAALKEGEARKLALERLTPEAIDTMLTKLRREVPIPDSRIPPRMVKMALDRGQRALVGSSDIYPDLLDALAPDGLILNPRLGARQVGKRFFEKHSLLVGQRALGNDAALLIIVALGQFVVFAGLFGGLGRAFKSAE